MLIHPRVIAIAALGAAFTLAGGAAAPGAFASASHPNRAAHPGGNGIPAGAGGQLIKELVSAWQITKGGGVTVAVLSTGVASVSGLSGKIIKGPDYAPVANPVLTDGTVLASLIAGSGPNSSTPIGTIGRAPAAKIMSVRIVAYGSGARAALKYQLNLVWQSIEAKAIRYATDRGAKVIVSAESGVVSDPSLSSAVAYAISKNVVVITSSFTASTDNSAKYPDSLPGVINVSGTAVKGLPGPFKPGHFPSNFSVLVTAPANDLFATGPGNQPFIAYGSYSAVAWAAGTVALIKSVYPQISPALVARALAISASYHPAGGYNTKIGFGLINPIGALRAAGQLVKLHSAAAPGSGVASPGTRFGSGSAPGVINAVRHSTLKLAGFSAGAVVGLLFLVLAFLLLRRGRRDRRGDLPVATSVSAESVPLPEPRAAPVSAPALAEPVPPAGEFDPPV